VTILLTNNFLFFKLVFKLVSIVTNNFWSLKLITNIFSDMFYMLVPLQEQLISKEVIVCRSKVYHEDHRSMTRVDSFC